MSFQFTQATRAGKRLRMAIIAPSGAGKSYSSLAIAAGLGGRVAVLDTERGSARLYAPKPGEPANPADGTFDFSHLDLKTFAPQTYVQAIEAAERAGFDVLIIDSLSHAWAGKDGALEMVDKASKRSNSGNSFAAWRDVTPHHNALVDKLVSCDLHLIVTMRSKTEYVLEEDPRTKKKVPRKVGMQPIQRDGLEYEFDVVGEMNAEHELIVSKTRCRALTDQVIHKPGAPLAAILKDWLGEAPPPSAQPATSPAPAPQPAASATAAPPDPEFTSARDALIPRCQAAVNGLRELGVDWRPIWTHHGAPIATQVTPANLPAFEAAVVAAENALHDARSDAPSALPQDLQAAASGTEG